MKTALILVDVQGTFADDFPGAGLPVPGSGLTVDPIREFTLKAAKKKDVSAVITSQDWHPEHLSEHMSETPDFKTLFPKHGVAGTAEAELHPRLLTPEFKSCVTHSVKKGQNSAAFSVWEGKIVRGNNKREMFFNNWLQKSEIQRVIVYGWEWAHCVLSSIEDLSENISWQSYNSGFDLEQVWVIPELCSVLDPSTKMDVMRKMVEVGASIYSPEMALELLT